jgi:hypothetical protein
MVMPKLHFSPRLKAEGNFLLAGSAENAHIFRQDGVFITPAG